MSRYRLYPSPERCRNEGFRITGFTIHLHVRRLNRRWGQVRVPKVGWVRFRWTRPVPKCKSYRVVITAALSTGERLHCPGMSGRERARLRKAERRKARAPKGSREQDAERTRVARLRAEEADRRKDWCEKVRCSACGWIDKNSRDSQAGFCCVACGFTCNADINASINIAAGHAGGTPVGVREPQLVVS